MFECHHNKYLTTVLLLIGLFLFACKSDHNPKNVIRIDEAYSYNLTMSDLFESIEYIPLETSVDFLIGNNPTVHVCEKFIVTFSAGNCLVFDRQTGKFIRKIGNRGRGAEEYSQIPFGSIVNEQEKAIVLGQGNRLIEYSLVDGSVKSQTVRIPQIMMNPVTYISKNVWALAILNISGSEPNQLLFFNSEELIDSVPNYYLFTPKTREVWINPLEILMYKHSNYVYFKHLFNDTVFRVVDNQLESKWVFETIDSPQILYQLRDRPSVLSSEIENYHLVYSILETIDFIFFTTKFQKRSYYFLYDKNLCKLIRLKNEGFANNIDGGLDFWPVFTNEKQDLIAVYHADILKEITEDIVDIYNITDIQAHNKLMFFIENLGWEDNPVVVIAKLKQ